LAAQRAVQVALLEQVGPLAVWDVLLAPELVHLAAAARVSALRSEPAHAALAAGGRGAAAHLRALLR
jgi:hypothetical protein